VTETTLDDLRGLLGYVYVATPYSRYKLGHAIAHIHACKATAELMRLGFAAVSPIAHSHPVSVHGPLDHLDQEFWLRQNIPLMDGASALVVVKLPGWRESVGVLDEIDRFIRDEKPIVFWDWQQ